jgi:hypothetical protein
MPRVSPAAQQLPAEQGAAQARGPAPRTRTRCAGHAVPRLASRAGLFARGAPPQSLHYLARQRRHSRPAPAPSASLLGMPLSAGAAFSDAPGLLLGAAANAAVMLAGRSVLLRRLTPATVAPAALMGTLVYAAFGPRSYLFVGGWLLLGSLAANARPQPSDEHAPAAPAPGLRSAASVWGSCAAGIACATSALAGWLSLDACRMGFVAGISSAMVGALALRGTFAAVGLSFILAFVAMLPLRQARRLHASACSALRC